MHHEAVGGECTVPRGDGPAAGRPVQAWSGTGPTGGRHAVADAGPRAVRSLGTPARRDAAERSGEGLFPVAGVVVTMMAVAWTAVFVAVFGSAMAAVSPWLSGIVNIAAATGIAPVLRRHRRTPTLRWWLWGVWPGIILGWAALAVAAL